MKNLSIQNYLKIFIQQNFIVLLKIRAKINQRKFLKVNGYPPQLEQLSK